MEKQLKLDHSFFRTGKLLRLAKKTRSMSGSKKSNLSKSTVRSVRAQSTDQDKYIVARGKSNLEGFQFHMPLDISRVPKTMVSVPDTKIDFTAKFVKNSKIHHQLDKMKNITQLFREFEANNKMEKQKKNDRQKKIFSFYNVTQLDKTQPIERREEAKQANRENQMSLSNFIHGNIMSLRRSRAHLPDSNDSGVN